MTVAATRAEVAALVQRGEGRALLRVLREVQDELERQLRRQRGGAFTAAHLRTTRAHVVVAIDEARRRLRGFVGDLADRASAKGARRAELTVEAGERQFKGLSWSLPANVAQRINARVHGARASLLRQHATSVDRYGTRMIGMFEKEIRAGLLTGAPVSSVIDRLVGLAGPKRRVSLAATELPSGAVKRLVEVPVIEEGLFVRSRYWAARIARTEALYAYNGAAQAGIEEMALEFPDMARIIVATFDKATGSDSIYVHGEIRGVHEPFLDGAGRSYLFPPARPNDREVVLPHRRSWPVPPTMRPKPPAVRAEAAEDGGLAY